MLYNVIMIFLKTDLFPKMPNNSTRIRALLTQRVGKYFNRLFGTNVEELLVMNNRLFNIHTVNNVMS